MTLTSIQQQFEQGLNAVNRFIWPAAEVIDRESKCFFVFKAYPKLLKREQIAEWSQLQSKTLSPFVAGQHYQHLSKAGLHLWFTQEKFVDIPETAAQQPLADGMFTVAGAVHAYKQTWKDGLLISCIASSSLNQENSPPQPLAVNQHRPWALTRKLDQQLKKPSTWLGLTLFASIAALLWFSTAYLTLTLQQISAVKQIDNLQDSLGEKLAQQVQLQGQQQDILMLRNWHNEYGLLPETFALVADKINLYGQWKANSINWQDRILVVELVASNLNIAALVTELEQVEKLAEITIRPNVNANTWTLEVSLK